MADTVNSKIVIVTGGASGIRLAMTRHFASQGHQVFIFDVDAKSGAAVAAEVTTEHPSAAVTFKRCDVTSWKDLCAAFGEVYLTAGKINIVMANAGTLGKGVSQLMDEDELVKPSTEVLDVNLLGMIYCKYSLVRFSGLVHQGLIKYSKAVRVATHYLRKNEPSPITGSRGLIMCTSSIVGLYPHPSDPIYGASKCGVIGLVRSMAKPLEQLGVQINCLAPSAISMKC